MLAGLTRLLAPIKRRYVYGPIFLIAAAFCLGNVQKDNQDELVSTLQRRLESELDRRIQQISCVDVEHDQESARYECVYVGNGPHDIDISYVDENELAPPFWVLAIPHRPIMTFVRTGTEGKPALTITFEGKSGVSSTGPSRADADYERNLIDAAIKGGALAAATSTRTLTFGQNDQFEISYDSCIGCERPYRLLVRGDGTYEFGSLYRQKTEDARRGVLSPTQLGRLRECIEAYHFDRFTKLQMGLVTSFETERAGYHMLLTASGKSYQVLDNLGSEGFVGEKNLRQFESDILSILNVSALQNARIWSDEND